MAWLPSVRVVLITDRRLMGDGSVVAFGDAVARAVAALPAGAVLVQVREEDLDGGMLLQLVHAAMASGAPVMVNDRLDVALATGAAGVHLPENGMSVSEVRRLSPDGFLIGQSLHTLAGFRDAYPRPIAEQRSDELTDTKISSGRFGRFTDAGQIRNAINEYLQIVRENPKDVRVWLRIGDLYTKTGAKQDATDTYLRVARFYHEQGFFLKAVAVYKQILKLDPSLVDVRRTLSELYRQLGLVTEAMLYSTDGPVEEAPPGDPRIVAQSADLVQLGPIFETPGKGPDTGTDVLRAARKVLDAREADAARRRASGIPIPAEDGPLIANPDGHVHLVAVGGISDATRAAECRAAGADAVAAIRSAWIGDVAALA